MNRAMKRTLTLVLLSFMALSCSTHHKTEGVRIPIIRYNPATYLTDIESALADKTTYECLYADSQQLSGVDKEILAFLSEEDAFIISLKAGDTESSPKFIGIKDKEEGYLKYLHMEEERYFYSLDAVIEDLYGSLEEYIATRPEDQRFMFYDNPQGLYTFPIDWHAMQVIGYGNSKAPHNPVKYHAAVSFLRTTRSEWNDDTWACDSTEIVKHSDFATGAFPVFEGERPQAKFEGNEPGNFTKWVNERIAYPDEALEDAAIGRVSMQFTIDMFGNCKDVKVLRVAHPALDSMAFKAVSSSPKWTPATDIVGNQCSIKYIFSVIFTPEMMFKAFINKMYNEKLYEDYDFLKKHCSPEVLKKLQDDYPYDSDKTEYATWLFRSGQQDKKPESDGKSMILEVTSDGDWYTCKALDMGWEFTKRIKVARNDNRITIEDINY